MKQPGLILLFIFFAFEVFSQGVSVDSVIFNSNGTHYLHRIEFPDSSGLACHIQQRFLRLPTWYFNSIPNHPNYLLGPVTGSICDTVLSVVNMKTENFSGLNIYPNPVQLNI